MVSCGIKFGNTKMKFLIQKQKRCLRFRIEKIACMYHTKLTVVAYKLPPIQFNYHETYIQN